MLAFMYEKDVVPVYIPADSDGREARTKWYSAIMHPEASCNVTFFEKAHKKLRRITSTTDDYESTNIPADVLSWDDAMLAMPQWADPASSYVFHRDDPDILPENRGQVLLQRVTEKGPSYMHAPVVLQHYLISKYSKSKIDPVIVDMAKYIRDTFSTEQLIQHILHDEGIPSHAFMRLLLERHSSMHIVWLDDIDAALLKARGPLLLSGFPLCDDFASDDDHLVHDLGACDAEPSPRPPPAPSRAPGPPPRTRRRRGGPLRPEPRRAHPRRARPGPRPPLPRPKLVAQAPVRGGQPGLPRGPPRLGPRPGPRRPGRAHPAARGPGGLRAGRRAVFGVGGPRRAGARAPGRGGGLAWR